MAMRYVFFLYLLTIVKTDTSSNTEKNVHETVNEEVILSPDVGVVRVARHPKLLQIVNPPHFNYASMTQQDPQTMRYAQQQEVDSYVRAYRLQQQARRPVIPLKQSPKNPQVPTITNGETLNINNVRGTLKQNLHNYPSGDKLSDQEMKVADPKYPTRSNNKFSNSDKSHKAESNHQKLTAVHSEEKVPKKNVTYEVGDKFLDQETDASNQRESRVYVGTEDLLNSAQYGGQYPAKPMYVLANSQLQLDPNLFAQGLASYALPENHQLRAAGFETASKSDLEALNALLGKAPTDQLHGLNHLLGQQVQNLQEPFPVLPEKQALVDFKELAPQSEALVGLKDLVQNQQIVGLKDLVQNQQIVGLKDLVQNQQIVGLKDLVENQQIVGLKDLVENQQIVGLKDLVQNQQIVGLKDLVENQQIVGLKDLVENVDLKDLAQQHQTNIGLADLVQQSHGSIELKDLIQQTQLVPEQEVYIQSEADIGFKDHTPIREEVTDFANTQSKPNVKIEVAQDETKIQNNIDHQLELARESKSVYGKDNDNLQYAAQYAFGYKIRDYHSGNDFGHEEIREGDVAKGRYHVVLPDGRLQNVEYWADPSGYHAKVTYSIVGHQ